ncbi:zinc-binding alcohol dehydrogenase family protein [Sorangium sp. So ce321]|uniref:zinc-binding alcohol dehydrogenase family protein n=1 Tax=Sorangium sp. So ce321 TaxID=3133300 RepID=UPI003F639152
MKALTITGPSAAQVTQIHEPEPAHDEVLIRVRRVGLCGSDLNTFLGKNPMVTYPRVLGHEVAGTIVELGSGVEADWRVGTDVTFTPYTACGVCPSCRAGRRNACRDNKTMGVQRDGALTELVAVPYQKLFTSRKLNLTELALVEPFSVGFHAAARGRVEAEETVLVMGCGGVGLGAIAGAVSRGARVIALDTQDEKLALARALGAREAVLAGADARERVMELTNGDGPDVVIEAVGATATYRNAVEWVKFCGRVVYIGYGKEPVSYETKLFVMKELDILGSRNCLGEFSDVIAFFERRTFDPNLLISRSIPIEGVPDALAGWAADPGRTSKIMVGVS